MDIFQLVPKGKLWQGKNIRSIFLALEDSMKRVLLAVDKIILEICPSTTIEFLANWISTCNANTRDEMLGILNATGGNTPAFYESVARKFDKDCQVLRNNPNNQFIAGVSLAGMSLGEQSIPRFCYVFHFSVSEPIKEAEQLLNKLKLAHFRFVYIYKTSTKKPFVAGISSAGDALNYNNTMSQKFVNKARGATCTKSEAKCVAGTRTTQQRCKGTFETWYKESFYA